MLVLVPPQVPKAVLVTRVPLELAVALTRHNRARGAARLQMAVHAGEVRRSGRHHLRISKLEWLCQPDVDPPENSGAISECYDH